MKEGNFLVPARVLFALFLRYYPQTLLFEYFNNEASILLPYDKKQGYRLNREAKLIHYEAVKLKTEISKRSLPNNPSLHKHFSSWLAKQSITKSDKGIPWFVVYDVYRNYCIDIGFKNPKAFKTLNDYLRFHFKFIDNSYGPAFFMKIDEKLLPPTRMYEQIRKRYQITDKKKQI